MEHAEPVEPSIGRQAKGSALVERRAVRPLGSTVPIRSRPIDGFRAGAVLVILALLCSPNFGDTVHLRNGHTLEGRIVSGSLDTGDPITVELAGGGRVTVPASQISRVVKKATPAEVLRERERELPDGEASAIYDLASWCRQKRLRKDSDRLLWRVLEVDPNHSAARRDLGFKKIGALWLTEADYRRIRGEVRYQGRWIPEIEWREIERRLLTERKLNRAENLFRTAAGTATEIEREGALHAFQTLDPRERNWALLKGTKSLKWRERQFAARQLGQPAAERQTRLLAHLAVTDPKRSVRDEALHSLRQIADPDTALSFVSYLGSDNDAYRVNAVRGINVFPDRRAAGPIITTLSKVWAGFGRVHFASITQRSYVKDYELVSGGTGLVVQEVADPVVDTFMSGVILDIQIRRVEAIARAAALRKITGRKYGLNFKKWEDWWAQETGRTAKTKRS